MDSKTLQFYAENAVELADKYNAVTDGISRDLSIELDTEVNMTELICGVESGVDDIETDDFSDSLDFINEFFSLEKEPVNSIMSIVATQKKKDKAWTSDAYDGFMIYMRQIYNIPRCSIDEENYLSQKIQAGDLDAREALIESNIKLVPHIAKGFMWANIDILDLIQEGNIGLMRAVENYDPNNGAKFSSYAAWWIKQSMRRHISNFKSTIRVPVQSSEKINKILSETRNYKDLYGKEIPKDILIQKTGFSERTIDGVMSSAYSVFPIEGLSSLTKSYSFYSYYASSNSSCGRLPGYFVDYDFVISEIFSFLEHLDKREKKVIELRFGLNGSSAKTLEETSQYIDRTRERVRQIELEALGNLKRLADRTSTEDLLYSSKCKYCLYDEPNIIILTQKEVRVEIKLALCEIFDEESIPLTQDQILKIWKRKYPKCHLSAQKLRLVLRNPLFRKFNGKTKFYSLKEWKIGENEIDKVLLEVKVACGILDDAVNSPLQDNRDIDLFETHGSVSGNFEQDEDLTNELLNMFLL